MTPVYLTSTYVQSAPGEHKGYEYSRTQNLTRHALQDCLAALEGAQHGLAFASGLAATDAILHLLDAGDHVVVLRRRLRRHLPPLRQGLPAPRPLLHAASTPDRPGERRARP